MFKRSDFSLIALLSVFIFGCASTHPGLMAQRVSGDVGNILVSAKNIEDPNKKPYQLIEFTIENKGDEWVKIQSGQMLVDDPATSKLSTVTGKDLVDWAQAKKFQIEKDQHNNEMAQEILLGTGAVLAASQGKNSEVGKLGALMAIGSIGWAVLDTINFKIDQAEGVDKVPENHIGSPSSVPGGLFVRKWILINKPSNVNIATLLLELVTIEGKRATYAIKMQNK